MKFFFNVDGVLIDGWHANSALRKPWDATNKSDLGVDREAFQLLFFSSPGKGDVREFMLYWFAWGRVLGIAAASTGKYQKVDPRPHTTA